RPRRGRKTRARPHQRTMNLKQQLRRDGFVLVPGLLGPDDLARLRPAAARLVETCRRGEHPTVRRSPARDDLWGAGHLFQPAIFEPAIIAPLCSDRVRAVNEELMGPHRLAVVSFLYNPQRVAWGGPWHRDKLSVAPHDPERYRAVVCRPTWTIQWNVPLYDDA